MEQDHSLEITLLTSQVRDAAPTLQEEFVVEAMKSCKEMSLAEEISLGIWRLWGSSFPIRTPTFAIRCKAVQCNLASAPG